MKFTLTCMTLLASINKAINSTISASIIGYRKPPYMLYTFKKNHGVLICIKIGSMTQ